MTRGELVAIVDLVRASWGRDSWRDDESKQVRAWWRYLQDLNYQDVLETIDMLVTRGETFPPTVGVIRRRTIDRVAPDGRPSFQEAWKQASERARAVETGLEWNEIHQTVADALRHAGFTGRGKLDERAFKASWDAVTETIDDDRYRVVNPEPFGEAK